MINVYSESERPEVKKVQDIIQKMLDGFQLHPALAKAGVKKIVCSLKLDNYSNREEVKIEVFDQLATPFAMVIMLGYDIPKDAPDSEYQRITALRFGRIVADVLSDYKCIFEKKEKEYITLYIKCDDVLEINILDASLNNNNFDLLHKLEAHLNCFNKKTKALNEVGFYTLKAYPVNRIWCFKLINFRPDE